MKFIVVTSINEPNDVLKEIAKKSNFKNICFVLIGDKKSPKNFYLKDCNFLNIEFQNDSFPIFSEILPLNHYARKNIGYLFAIKNGATIIQETDDDNLPLQDFWNELPKDIKTLTSKEQNWINIYSFFSETNIWPRGFPLEYVNQDIETEFISSDLMPLVYQGLADENPDVDAIYRMTRSLPVIFEKNDAIMLNKYNWCPFNSQNTIFLKKAFPFLYLPSTCTFRMTDIWRSFIAQRCLWEIGGGVVFHNATVVQNRNEHNLLHDFKDEIPGYLNNKKIIEMLEDLELTGQPIEDLKTCYAELIKEKIFDLVEMDILNEWINEIKIYI